MQEIQIRYVLNPEIWVEAQMYLLFDAYLRHKLWIIIKSKQPIISVRNEGITLDEQRKGTQGYGLLNLNLKSDFDAIMSNFSH